MREHKRKGSFLHFCTKEKDLVLHYTCNLQSSEQEMSKQNRIKQQTVARIKIQRGLDRQHFLETNGDMKQWHPPRIVVPDKKKAKSRRACRGKQHG